MIFVIKPGGGVVDFFPEDEGGVAEASGLAKALPGSVMIRGELVTPERPLDPIAREAALHRSRQNHPANHPANHLANRPAKEGVRS